MIKRKLIIGDLTVGGEPPPTPPKTPTPQHTRPDDPEWQPFGQRGYRCPDCTFASFSVSLLAEHRLQQHNACRWCPHDRLNHRLDRTGQAFELCTIVNCGCVQYAPNWHAQDG